MDLGSCSNQSISALRRIWYLSPQAVTSLRCLSTEIHFGPSDGQLEGILDRTLEKEEQKTAESPHVLTTRREALALGELWRDSIRDSARKEFDLARHLTEPEVVTRLLLTGRDCLQQTVDKFMKKREGIIEAEVKQPPLGPA